MSDMIVCPPDDPRLTSKWGLGIHRFSDAPDALCIALVLMERRNDTQPYAINILAPSQAREMALGLWQMAEEADRAMNAVFTREEGR